MPSTSGEVILGVGAGIAAFKSCDLLRRLQDRGYSVTVVPTPSSLNFVGAATWAALSGRAVATTVWENSQEVSHISLADRADFFIIAPATADLIARIAAGRADDLLTNLILASDIPMLIVPAMHPAMWSNPATLSNVALLRKRGYVVMEPEVGRLTGVDSGQGRFPTTSSIIDAFDEVTGNSRDLVGKKILVTAGGTREAIDPVRFIGNRSSGKQGLAIAQAAAMRGADVHLIAANINGLQTPGVTTTHVESAAQLGQALNESFATCDVLIMAAAVADAKPISAATEKIKKALYTSISLAPNPDLLLGLFAIKDRQVVIGFAAETSDHITSARAKMLAKGLDLIYVNDVSEGAIFGSEFTNGTILSKDEADVELKEISKVDLAHILLDLALKQLG